MADKPHRVRKILNWREWDDDEGIASLFEEEEE